MVVYFLQTMHWKISYRELKYKLTTNAIAPPLFEGTLRTSNVCDDGNFSSPKEYRQVLSHSDGGE